MKKGFVSMFVFILAVIFASTVFSCASTPSNTPPWLNDFPPDNVLWGIGSARQSSMQLAWDTADGRARTSIARQLDTRVQAMFIDYNRDAGTAAAQASTSLQESVSRLVTDINVSGARPIRRWEAPDGTWWFLLEYRKDHARDALADILLNQQAQYAQFRAQEALRMLDAQLQRNERALVVNN